MLSDTLKESQLVIYLANWLWLSSTDNTVSPEICLETIPFLTSPCLTTLLTKLLGLGMIVGACLNKAPILLNIFKTKSTIGLSLGACYGEVILFSNAAFYGIVRDIPFTAWGENGVMTLQALWICVLYWRYFSLSAEKKDLPSSSITIQHKIQAILCYCIYIGIILFLLPSEYAYILQVLNWPVLIYARGAQIIYTYKVKHTGTQSMITSFMNFLGSAIRIGTTLQEVGLDFALLFGFILSLILNVISLVQFYLYSSNTTTFLEELTKKKQ